MQFDTKILSWYPSFVWYLWRLPEPRQAEHRGTAALITPYGRALLGTRHAPGPINDQRGGSYLEQITWVNPNQQINKGEERAAAGGGHLGVKGSAGLEETTIHNPCPCSHLLLR